MKKSTTAKAFVMSVLALMMCLSMLVGTTFAWFTDSVTSGVNKIVAGNLDVELEYSTDPDAGEASWKTVTEATNMFKDALWEPGYTEVVYLRVKNAGTLALRYQFGINVADNNFNGTSQPIDLSQHIKFGVKETTGKFGTRDAARQAVQGTAKLISAGYASEEGHLKKGATSGMLALVVYMPEGVGNEANHKTGDTPPEIKLGINLVATQDTVESDSFGTDYDAGAKYPDAEGGDADWYQPDAMELTISKPAHLIDLAQRVNAGDTFEGKTITLANDIALDRVSNWVPIGTEDKPFMGTLDGAGHTVSGLVIDSEIDSDTIAFVGVAKKATIKNLTVSGNITVNRAAAGTVTVSGGTYVAGICAYAADASTIEKCVSEVDIKIDAFAGDQLCVGGILGTSNNGGASKIIDCLNCGNISYNSAYPFENAVFIGGITAVDYRGLSTLKNVVNVGEIQKGDAEEGGCIASAGISTVVEDLAPTGNNWFSTTCDMLTYLDKLNENGTPNDTKPTNESDFSSLLGDGSSWVWNESLGYPVLKY